MTSDIPKSPTPHAGRDLSSRIHAGRSVAYLMLILLMVALYLAVRVAFLDQKAFTNDEGFSLRVARQDIASIIRSLANDVHPPLYFVFLHAWLEIFRGEQAGRLMSAVCGALAAIPIFLFARHLLGTPRALPAALLCAVLPLHVSWSQTSRMYALLLLLAMLAILVAARLLEAFDKAADPAAPREDRHIPWRLAIAYVVLNSAMLWTHNLTVFLVAAFNAVAAYRLLVAGRGSSRSLLAWSACQIVVLLSWAPWIPVILGQMSNLRGEQFLLDVGSVLAVVSGLFGGFMLWSIGAVAAGVFILGIAMGASRLDPSSASVQVALSAIVVPLLACLALYASGRAAFGYAIGTLIWIPAIGAILLAAALPGGRRSFSPGTALGAVFFLAFSLLSLRGVWNVYATSNPGWDRLVQRLAEQAGPQDTILAQIQLDHDGPSRARGEVPFHSLVMHLERGRRRGAMLGEPVLPEDGNDQELLSWLQQRRLIWVPRTAAMAGTALAERAVRLAEQNPAQWAVTHEPLQRLVLTRIARRDGAAP